MAYLVNTTKTDIVIPWYRYNGHKKLRPNERIEIMDDEEWYEFFKPFSVCGIRVDRVPVKKELSIQEEKEILKVEIKKVNNEVKDTAPTTEINEIKEDVSTKEVVEETKEDTPKEEVAEEEPKEDLSKKTFAELKKMAKEKGLDTTAKKKADLLKMLQG